MAEPQSTRASRGRQDPRIRQTPNQVETTCAQCGTPLYYYPSQIAKSDQHFCDRHCLGKWHSLQTGTKAMHWRGGTRRDRQRIMWHLPWHPRAINGYIYRYTLIAEWKLGRRLRDGEIVHHIDGDQTNDHPDNLEVMTQSDHARRHFTLNRWSRDFDQCRACGSAERKHEGRGLCTRCFQRAKKGAA